MYLQANFTFRFDNRQHENIFSSLLHEESILEKVISKCTHQIPHQKVQFYCKFVVIIY